jgi:hypothetical protein
MTTEAENWEMSHATLLLSHAENALVRSRVEVLERSCHQTSHCAADLVQYNGRGAASHQTDDKMAIRGSISVTASKERIMFCMTQKSAFP